MKNRFNHILREHNQEIRKLDPACGVLWYLLGREMKKIERPGLRVLEIGCGEGDSALEILQWTKVSIDLLDVSQKMIQASQKSLHRFSKRTKYICEDALQYLSHCQPYDVIFSSLTIHNFIQKDKTRLLQAIYNTLLPGGFFVLVDIVAPSRETRNCLQDK